LYGKDAVRLVQRTREDGPIIHVAAHHLDTLAGDCTRLRLIRIARKRAHRKALLPQVTHDGPALVAGRTGNEDHFVLVLVGWHV